MLPNFIFNQPKFWEISKTFKTTLKKKSNTKGKNIHIKEQKNNVVTGFNWFSYFFKAANCNFAKIKNVSPECRKSFQMPTNYKVCLFCKLGNNCLFNKSHCFEKKHLVIIFRLERITRDFTLCLKHFKQNDSKSRIFTANT